MYENSVQCAVQCLPLALQQAIRGISILKQPSDYWQPGQRGQAHIESGVIHLFCQPADAGFVFLLAHESAHLYGTPRQWSVKEAALSYGPYGFRKGCVQRSFAHPWSSEYAKHVGIDEDWADSVALYVADYALSCSAFPNKTRVIKDLLT